MRTCILLTARSGSTFMRHMLMHGKTTKDGAQNPNPLRTVPSSLHYNEDWLHGHLINDYIMKTPNPVDPEVYSFYVGTEWERAFYDSLPGPREDWRFVYILRDPRSKIESQVKWAATDPRNLPASDIFKMECEACKIRLRAISTMRNDPRFRIFSFENMVRDPLESFGTMLEFGGLKIDYDYYEKLVQSWWQQSNSSFGDRGAGSAIRWLGWTQDQKEYFKSVLGKELIYFEFEKSNDW